MSGNPAANDPSPNDEVPWAMRYTLPVASLAVAALLVFAYWIYNL